jgi:sulfur-oxidizing protein SoxY
VKPTSLFFDQRRTVLAAGLGAALFVLVRPVRAAVPSLQEAVDAFAAGAKVQQGRVKFDIAALVENGNTVPITVTVDNPMTAADHVRTIAVFNERNPQREVLQVALGPRAGKAQVSTRIRLATSQKLVALARMSDGSVWSQPVDVLVTLAACLE